MLTKLNKERKNNFSCKLRFKKGPRIKMKANGKNSLASYAHSLDWVLSPQSQIVTTSLTNKLPGGQILRYRLISRQTTQALHNRT